MAFNVPHFGTISSNSTIVVGYIFGSGEDHGAQFAEGNPENPGGDLIAHWQRIFRDGNGNIHYSFQLQNIGANTSFTLAGGSLS